MWHEGVCHEHVLEISPRLRCALYEFTPALDGSRNDHLIILLHGLRLYGLHHLTLIRELLDAGYSVLTLDLVGHGNSSGEQRGFRSFLERFGYRNGDGERCLLRSPKVFLTLMRSVLRYAGRYLGYNGKISIVGYSTGALAACYFLIHATPKERDKIDATVCVSMPVVVDHMVEPYLRTLKQVVPWVVPGLRWLSPDIKDVTDDSRTKKYILTHPMVCTDKLRICTLWVIDCLASYVREKMPLLIQQELLQTRFMIVSGKEDPVVGHATAAWADAIGSDRVCVCNIHGKKHEMLIGPNSGTVRRKIIKFLE